jgi:hypothetical protein
VDAAIYQDKIRKAEKGLGVYRPEFTQTRVRLANIYVRIEMLQKAFERGEFQFTTFVQTKNGEQEVTDPHIIELDTLNNQALAYEKALGLTAESARKILPDLFAPQEESASPLAVALRRIG